MCLVAYPYTEWRKIEEKFTGDALAQPKVQRFQRYFLASAIECAPDSHGRILIPPTLRDEARLDKEVVLLGMLNRFEIWCREILEQELQQVRDDFDEHSSFVASQLS